MADGLGQKDVAQVSFVLELLKDGGGRTPRGKPEIDGVA